MSLEKEKLQKKLKTRSELIQAVRDFFSGLGYLEIDTPLRSPAIIPEAYINPVQSEESFLQASPELYMKRFLSREADKLFQICKCFRKNERGRKHLPELTMPEWYGTDINYLDMMKQCEEMIRFVASKTGFHPPCRSPLAR